MITYYAYIHNDVSNGKTHPNNSPSSALLSAAEVLKAQVRQRVRQDAAVAVIGDGVEESHHPEEVHQQDPGVGHLVECPFEMDSLNQT